MKTNFPMSSDERIDMVGKLIELIKEMELKIQDFFNPSIFTDRLEWFSPSQINLK